MPTHSSSSKHNLFISLVSLSLLLTILTIVLSAYIRLSVNGLGCDSWPDCYGRINITVQHQGIDVLTGAGASMQHTGIRTLHRLVASVLGIFVVGIAVMALWRRGVPEQAGTKTPLLIFAVTVFLSWLGYATPTPLVPAVTLGNLLGGLLLLALLWWLSQRIAPQQTAQQVRTCHFKPKVLLGLVLLTLQICLGAWTSAFFAGPACPELGACSGVNWSLSALNIFAEMSLDAQGKILNPGTAEMIHLLHRIGAIITATYLAWLGMRIMAYKDDLRTSSSTLLVLLGLEFALGLLSIPMQLPLLMVTAHNAVAAILLLTMINLYHLLSPHQARVQ